MSLTIDYGSKTDDIYEYHPRLPLTSEPTISFDVGKYHYGVWIEDREKNRCLYAGIWKIGSIMNLETQKRLTFLLDRISKYYVPGSTVVIERQMGTNINMIIQLEQHTLSYFELRQPQCNVVRIQSSVKYRRMGDEMLGDKKSKRKEWAVTKTLEICKERDDKVVPFLTMLHSLRNDKVRNLKCDDVGDAFIQLLAHYKK